MIKFLKIAAVFIALGIIGHAGHVFAASGEIRFCEELTDDFRLIKPGNEFPAPTVSWLAASSQAFGSPTIVISIYKDTTNSQSLLSRREVEVNPAWNNIGLRNMPLGEPGRYTIIVSRKSGEEIASGSVTLLPAVSDAPAKPEKKVGGTLEDLFNRYKSMN